MNDIVVAAHNSVLADRFERHINGLPEHLRAAARAYADALTKFEDEQYSDLVMEQRSLQWQGEWLPVGRAAEQMELVPDYENFHGKRLADFFRHNEAMFDAIRFGREYSPVVYVKLRNQTDRYQFINRMKSFRANEIQAREDGSIRVWWD